MIVALLFAAGQFYAQPTRKVDPEIEKLVPQDVLGWIASSEDLTYSAATLHEYIDGASEIYKALNVCRVVARRYVRQGFPQITADIFEMKGAADAFGAYHHDIREGAEVKIGKESEYEGATLAFWKGRYVVYVTAATASEPVREAILAIGRAVSGVIQEDPPPPDLLKLLPKSRLNSGDTRYFHDHFLLNLYYYVADENVLNLTPETEGVLARYKTRQGAPITCLVIRYGSGPDARAAEAKFTGAYLAGAEAGLGITENGRWTGFRAKGNLACVVFDAPERADAISLLDKICGGAEK